MKNKAKPTPVHSFAILPDGDVLPIPDCRGFSRWPNGTISVYNKNPKLNDPGLLTLVVLPAGSTLVTNWAHPDHQ
jgi:hypothetical protein